MVLGLGVDLADVPRMRRAMERQEGLCERLFCDREISYCRGKRYPYTHFAARFAAKEAFLKALGTGLRGKMNWLEMEVRSDELGRPSLQVQGECLTALRAIGGKTVHLSLTHQAGAAVAVVLIEG